MTKKRDDLLDSILKTEDSTAGEEMEATENEFLEPVLEHINLIKNEAIRSMVRAVLLHCPTFWVVPSSFSGQTHPPDEYMEGGNVLHTKRTATIVYIMATAQERPVHEIDVLMAAALIHDATKGIHLPDDTVSYDPLHPYTVDRIVDIIRSEESAGPIEDRRSNTLLVEDEVIRQILRLVRTHMGLWSPIPETYPVASIEWVLPLANAIATNLHLLVEMPDVTPPSENGDSS